MNCHHLCDSQKSCRNETMCVVASLGMSISILQSMEVSETVSRSFAGQQQQQQVSENSQATIAASRGVGLDKVSRFM